MGSTSAIYRVEMHGDTKEAWSRIDGELADISTDVDVCEIADHLAAQSFDTVVYDPPFSTYQASRSYDGKNVGDVALAKRQFHALLRPGGRVIQFGFTTTNMPMSLGYEREAVAIFNTLGQMNDYLGTVDRRLNGDITEWSE